MKNPILYTITAAALAAVAAIAIVGCDGDFGERSENMDYFLDKFSGKSNRYTITFNANGASKGSPPQPIDVIKDSTTNLPSNTGGLSKTGFYFGGWSEDSLGKYGNHVTGGQYTPKSNVMLYAIWLSEDGVRRIVTVVSVGAGSSGSGEYESDTTVRIDAGTAPEGQQFQNWKSAPSVTFANSNSPTTTFTMPRENVTVKANFGAVTEGKYAVTVASIGVGGSGKGSYAAGETVRINAGADPFGHRFQNWTTESAGVIFGNANNRATTFVMPGNAVTVTANFYEVPTYKVTVTSVGKGASADSSYREGDTVTIKAGEAPDKKRFKDWTVTGGDVTLANDTNTTTTFIMPARAVAVTANFRDNTYTVTVSSVGAGATGGGEYYPGATVSITAGTLPSGFTFNGWTCSNSNVAFSDANNAATTFIMPTAAVTITVNFGGTFTDGRDGQKYAAVTIGGKLWMGENLNYEIADGTGSWCYSNNPENCAKYGRLYNWSTVRTVCPTGWHLPSRAEWGKLAIAAGGTGTYGAGGTAGKALKSKSGWKAYQGKNGNGTDDFGFSALPGGSYQGGVYYAGGDYGYWWTATEDDASGAYLRTMHYNDDDVNEDTFNRKEDGFSVRCIGD